MAQSAESETQSQLGSTDTAARALPGAAAAHCGKDRERDALPDRDELLSADGGYTPSPHLSSGTCESELI